MGYKIKYVPVQKRTTGRMWILTGFFFLLFCCLAYRYMPEQSIFAVNILKNIPLALLERMPF